MKHFLANLTWRCQNRCSYCWLNLSVRARPEMLAAAERGLDDWARAIRRDCVDVVELAGGEPLLVEWLPDLIEACPNTSFGLSTNGRALYALERLVARRPRNLIALNLSYHPETPGGDRQYRAALNLLLEAGVRIHTNIVAAPGVVEKAQDTIRLLEERGVIYEISPYERVETLGEKLPQGLRCRGGVDHLTIAPDGSAWPCLTTLRSPYWRETCLGNWLDGEIDLAKKPQPCYLNCVDYYILPHEHVAGDMWGIAAEPWQ